MRKLLSVLIMFFSTLMLYAGSQDLSSVTLDIEAYKMTSSSEYQVSVINLLAGDNSSSGMPVSDNQVVEYDLSAIGSKPTEDDGRYTNLFMIDIVCQASKRPDMDVGINGSKAFVLNKSKSTNTDQLEDLNKGGEVNYKIEKRYFYQSWGNADYFLDDEIKYGNKANETEFEDIFSVSDKISSPGWIECRIFVSVAFDSASDKEIMLRNVARGAVYDLEYTVTFNVTSNQ